MSISDLNSSKWTENITSVSIVTKDQIHDAKNAPQPLSSVLETDGSIPEFKELAHKNEESLVVDSTSIIASTTRVSTTDVDAKETAKNLYISEDFESKFPQKLSAIRTVMIKILKVYITDNNDLITITG